MMGPKKDSKGGKTISLSRDQYKDQFYGFWLVQGFDN